VVGTAKSKQAKAHEISINVKKAVAKRDSVDGYPCCICCGKPAPTENPLAYSNAHIVKRSQGGLGVETNIVTLCDKDHYKFDDSTERPQILHFICEYMKSHYSEEWSMEAQVYKK
jgi:hypothetical protein